MPMDVETYLSLALDQPCPEQANGHSNAEILNALNAPGVSVYHPCAEAYPGADMASGKVHSFRAWESQRYFKDTIRDIWLYLPANQDDLSALNLIVCNDGGGYLDRQGAVRATAVLDTLHHQRRIAATAAIFIMPGRPKSNADDFNAARQQRSFEYDSLTPLYGEFILDEVMPFLEKEAGCGFSQSAENKIVCGISSGGICAFTLAWHHPHAFTNVISHCGSFTNIRGGHEYPYLIRSSEKKPIKVFLQSGKQDASILFGDWPLANQTMAKALAYAGYDYRFEFGEGGHSLRHAGALFADTLKWIWPE